MSAYQAIKNPVNRQRLWFLVDATGQRVGRLASIISSVLQGKHKPFYHPAIDQCGDCVVVINADKVTFSGRKEQNKLYRHHTGWMGGLKEIPVRRLRERNPTLILRHAVHGMLPKNRTRWRREDRLRLLTSEESADLPFTPQLQANPYRLRLPDTRGQGQEKSDKGGFVVRLLDQDEALALETKPVESEKLKEKMAEKNKKVKLQKELRAYLLGRGKRPSFLPQPETKKD